MKYLVLYREDTTMSAVIPPPLLIEAVEATGHWLGEMKKAGKATEAMFMAGLHGGMAVLEAKSGGELADLIESNPARPFCKVEIIPLMSTEEYGPVLAKARQRIGDMMQKMAKLAGPR